MVLAVFNLLPASPLDGGRVLHSVVWAVTHDRWRATKIAANAGVWLGTAMVAAGFLVLLRGEDPLDGFFISVVGWWLLGSARTERQLGRVRASPSTPGSKISEIDATRRRGSGLDHHPLVRRDIRHRAPWLGLAARAVGHRRLRGCARGRLRRRGAVPAVGPAATAGRGRAHQRHDRRHPR